MTRLKTADGLSPSAVLSFDVGFFCQNFLADALANYLTFAAIVGNRQICCQFDTNQYFRPSLREEFGKLRLTLPD